MKAILLCAGKGTRLRPLTDNTPKCLMPINNKPLLDYWLHDLDLAGIDSYLINTHHLRKKLEKYLFSHRLKGKIKTVYENQLLGTAGTLIKNIKFFDNEDGLLIHADNLCEEKISNLINAHKERQKNCLITLISFRTNTPSTCGILEVDENNIVTAIHEKVKNPHGNLANGAVYILSKEIYPIIEKKYKDAFDFTLEILKNFEGQIFSYETNQKFIDIGTIDNYKSVIS